MNNRRSKTKSYSPACLRTVQIESKTRGEGKLRSAEAGNPPPPPSRSLARSAALPRSPRPPPRSRPPPSALPPQCLFQACATGRCRRGNTNRPAGRCGSSRRRRRSLAGSAAFIISPEKSISFHFPTSRPREQQAAVRQCAARAPGRSNLEPGVRGRGLRGRQLGLQASAGWRQEGKAGTYRLPILKGDPKVGKEGSRLAARGSNALAIPSVGQVFSLCFRVSKSSLCNTAHCQGTQGAMN